MASIAVYYCLFLLFCFGVLEGNGACGHINYTTINNIRRSTAYKATTGLCDRGFIKDGSWYRFQSDAGDKMPEFNPGINSCGTYVPIWLKGNHPSTVGVEVDRMACAPLPHAYPFDCGLKYKIKVINCGLFFLYQLKEPSSCHIAYCAGTKLGKGCSADGSSIPVCSGVVPNIMRPKVRPKDEDREYVSLRCFWDYFDDASHVEFHVKWFKDSNETTHAIQHMFNGTANKNNYENLYERQLFRNRVNGSLEWDERGYEWNKRVFCQVRGRFHGGGWSPWKSSGTIFTGVAVRPRTIYLHECESDREIFVSLRPHLPIRNTSYKFEIGYEEKNKNTLAKICIRGRISGGRCLAELTERHKFYYPMWIRITAVCPTVVTGETTKEVIVKFHNDHYIQGSNTFWSSYKFLPIKVTMASRNTKFCKSLTDPNIETFDRDGWYYNPYKEGTFRLYRNRLSGTEVQARLDSCCNCGVAIKEGYYFKIVELCSSLHQALPNIRSSHHPDMPKNGFYVERTSTEFTIGQEIIVHMPSGITVSITRRWWSIDIIIKAPEPYAKRPGDKHRHSEGLCGNFNGDPDDDYEGLTMPEFVETHRIQPGSNEDIFAYTGNEAEEKDMYEKCLNEQICVCRHGANVGCDNPATVNECSPPEQNSAIQNLHGDICRGGRTTRNDDTRKRAIDMRDDDIDDQDIIPLYNPPKRNFTVPSWPTPSGLTEKNVTSLCNKRIRYSKAGESCSNVDGVNLDALVNQCITDIQFTDDPSWAVANAGALNNVCKKNVYKNVSYYKNSTDGVLKLETNVLDSLCPNDCSDRGNCSNSTCTCFEDYTAADCSVSLKDSPKLYGIRKSGLCDVRRRPCRNVGIYAFPLLDSANLTCHVQEIKVIESVWVPDRSISLFPGLMMDITEVKCFLPESPVNIGDYGNEGVAAAGIKIAVSNNRINASKESLLFITYDSVCQECNVSTGCQLKADACSISGHCFAKSESHPDDWCRQCLPYISTSSWENRTENQSPKFNILKTFYAFLGKELRVQLDAIDPENRTIRYSFTLQNTSLGASLTENGFFSWTTTTNNSEVFMFKVTDECGAYSSVNASVAIKDCPCKNKGECFPDYRYLDGAGNFKCSCPVEYTGVLCENDVNECNVSQPCFNGTCSNKIPGFSCSCFAGYTGRFCENEIDECAYQPCFPGVLCTDLIASFSCGPCPKGYTGNGENCTRIDGKVDECVRNPQACHENANCQYNNGSYACQCIHGYSGDGKNNCTDVDECSITPDICHRNATCTNSKGSYSCGCLKGFTGDGHRSCSDINECTNLNACNKNARCSNLVGSYVCKCTVGYSGDGYINCTDINECTAQPVCHQNGTCSNTQGSFSCQCNKGYSGDGKLHCEDIDECEAKLNTCHPLANCSNILGSYSCQCNTGFFGDGKLTCEDVNECNSAQPACHQNATCSNSQGSFSCQCKKGFSGDGKLHCKDIDECFYSTPVCHKHAKCTNTMGYYSCKCNQGFFGDAIHSCTENQPPEFITQSLVYAILDKDFQIHVDAKDSESQNITFTLLPNGTLTTAIMAKQLLTVPKLKTNGTVFIQAEDQMGAKSILILQVFAIVCPCKNEGECYHNKTVLYPKQPSDYQCKCGPLFSGKFCGTRRNPCRGHPCYPGLVCSSVNNSGEFTCEDCPPLFEGDGKQCKLQPNKGQNIKESEMTLTDEKWDDQLKNDSSDVYKNLVLLLTVEIRKIYKEYGMFSYVIIKGFRPGSIIVEFQLIFTEKVEDPLKPLLEVAKSGTLGNMTMKINHVRDGKPPGLDEDKLLGLDKSIFYVIVGVVFVLILVVSFATYRHVKRRQMQRKAELRKKELFFPSDKKAKGISFQQTGDDSEGRGEIVDLKVFDNEAISLDEEVKIQP